MTWAVHIVRGPQGELGFEILAGGGLGRTPVIGQVVRDFLPREYLLSYLGGRAAGLTTSKGGATTCRRRASMPRDLGVAMPPVSRIEAHSDLDPAPDVIDAERRTRILMRAFCKLSAPPFEVVDPQHGLEVGQKIFARQEIPHHLADDGRAAQASAGENLESQFALRPRTICTPRHAPAMPRDLWRRR